jgi:hypothetical protein
MNRKLMAALGVVLVATAYLQLQGDDELLAKPEQGAASGKSHRGGRTEARAEGQTASRPDARGASGTPSLQSTRNAAASGDSALAPWVADALVRGARAWQGRSRASSAEPEGSRYGLMASTSTSAWSAALPPPAPVIRPPVPTDTVVVAPSAPTAPRFPHQWVGRFNQGAVLSGADATWVVQAGDVIEGQWRVDRVEEHRMSLTYLPLNLTQQVVMR